MLTKCNDTWSVCCCESQLLASLAVVLPSNMSSPIFLGHLCTQSILRVGLLASHQSVPAGLLLFSSGKTPLTSGNLYKNLKCQIYKTVLLFAAELFRWGAIHKLRHTLRGWGGRWIVRLCDKGRGGILNCVTSHFKNSIKAILHV